jgi:hypothetical protein
LGSSGVLTWERGCIVVSLSIEICGNSNQSLINIGLSKSPCKFFFNIKYLKTNHLLLFFIFFVCHCIGERDYGYQILKIVNYEPIRRNSSFICR